MNAIRVFLVDDHAVMRMGLASLLGTCRELEVVGDAGDGEAALRKIARLKPDVVIMDLLMPGMDGVEATRRVLNGCTGDQAVPGVLILTTSDSSDGINAALAAGALGAILKSSGLPELRRAIRAVAAGERYLSDEIAQILALDPPLPELSHRQRQILQDMVWGLSNPDIAAHLSISVPVVKEYSAALFAKLGVSNRTKAVALAVRRRLVEVDGESTSDSCSKRFDSRDSSEWR